MGGGHKVVKVVILIRKAQSVRRAWLRAMAREGQMDTGRPIEGFPITTAFVAMFLEEMTDEIELEHELWVS